MSCNERNLWLTVRDLFGTERENKGMIVRAIAWGVVAALILSACRPAVDPSKYAAELEICLQVSGSCESYVACRKAVAEKYGRTFDASCKK